MHTKLVSLHLSNVIPAPLLPFTWNNWKNQNHVSLNQTELSIEIVFLSSPALCVVDNAHSGNVSLVSTVCEILCLLLVIRHYSFSQLVLP